MTGFALAGDDAVTIRVYTGSFDGNGEIIDNSESIHTDMTWDSDTPITFGAGGLPAITDGGGFTRINIFATSEHDLGLITVRGSGTSNVHLIIGNETRATITAPSGDFARDGKGIVAQRSVRLKMSIARDIRANVLCTDIRRIDADGSHIAGDIQASAHGPRMV